MIFSNPVANFYMVKSLNGSFLFLTLLHLNSRQLFIFVTIRVPTVWPKHEDTEEEDTGLMLEFLIQILVRASVPSPRVVLVYVDVSRHVIA